MIESTHKSFKTTWTGTIARLDQKVYKNSKVESGTHTAVDNESTLYAKCSAHDHCAPSSTERIGLER